MRKGYTEVICPNCNTIREIRNDKIRLTKHCRSCSKLVVSNKQGKSTSRLCGIWYKMLDRCNNTANIHYEYYGGRGIKVCEEWKDYVVFEAWALGNGYAEHLTIDRIKNDTEYSPTNCRWATRSEQSRNTRLLSSVNTSGFRGVTFNKRNSKWKAQIKLKGTNICIGSRYETAERAGRAYDTFVTLSKLTFPLNFPIAEKL